MSPDRSGTGSEHPRVALLADDRKQESALLTRIMSGEGWNCTCASDRESFERSLQADTFTVVIAREDCFGLSSEELIQKIEGARPGQAVIVLQQGEAKASSDLWKQREALFVLTEPVSAEHLKSVLGQFGPSGMSRISGTVYQFEDFSESYELSSFQLAQSGLAPTIFERIRAAKPNEMTEALQIELAFQEALANALEHGNLELLSEWREQIDENGVDRFSITKEDRLRDSTYANRLIQVFLSITDNTLTVEIRDEGPGFQFQKKTVTDDAEEELKCYGRGRKLMNLVMDEVHYSNGGRTIQLKKRI